MTQREQPEDRWHGHHHDWQSPEYVGEWISNDVTRDGERRPFFQEMFGHLPFGRQEAVTVLDIGAGYGIVTEELLKLFPNARVTLQDFSAAMFDHARRTLAPHAEQTTFVQSDLTGPWTEPVGGPFDLAVSAIAIHNLGKPETISKVYGEVATVLKPQGLFLNMDYVFSGGIDGHMGWLKEDGFARVECRWYDGRLAAFFASKS